MNQRLINTVRFLTNPFVFRKKLPADFGNRRIYVTSRADLRLLFPGLERAGGDLMTVARRYVHHSSIVWDIGSNLGIFTFCAAARVGPSGRVYSMEADPRYADLQSRTLSNLTDEKDKIRILCAAAADRFGLLELNISRKGHARNHLSIVKGNQPGETEMKKNVIGLTLDWLLENGWSAPTFIKLDVEGAECLACRGGTNLFTKYRPSGYIECAPENRDELSSFFRNLQYRFYSIRGDSEIEIPNLEFNTIIKPHQ